MGQIEVTTWHGDPVQTSLPDSLWPPWVRIVVPLVSVAIFSITVIAVYMKPHRSKPDIGNVDRTVPFARHPHAPYVEKDRSRDLTTKVTLLSPNDITDSEYSTPSGILKQAEVTQPKVHVQSTADPHEEYELESEICSILQHAHMDHRNEQGRPEPSSTEVCEAAPAVRLHVSDPTPNVSSDIWLESTSQSRCNPRSAHSMKCVGNVTINGTRNKKTLSPGPHISTVVQVEHHSPTHQ